MKSPIINTFILLLLLLISCSTITAQELKRPKVAVVLSGGGAKGFAHIGALKVLEEQGIPIDIIVGTSMGAVVGGLYSLGYSSSEIEAISISQDWNYILSDDVSRTQLSKNRRIANQQFVFSLPTDKDLNPSLPQGVINGQNIINLFCDLASNVPVDADFNDFPIRFACIGADLATGKEVIINNGFFPTAIYSSMAIPGVFTPMEHNGFFMIDGGIVNNFPADIAKKMGADIIIGVDIRDDLHKVEDIVSISEVLDQLINFFSIEKDSINDSYCSLIIRPDITGYNASSFNHEAVITLIKRGEDASRKKIKEIQLIKNNNNLSKKQLNRKLIKSDTYNISEINFTGVYHLNDKLIHDNLNLNIPGNYSYQEIKNAIDRVYGLGSFETVHFNIEENEDGNKILDIVLKEKTTIEFNLGLRINTMDAVSLLINYSQYNNKRHIGYFSITADICSNPEINIYAETSKGKLPVIGIELNGKYQVSKIYANGEKISVTDLFYGEAKGFLYQSINKNTVAGLGLSVNFYAGDFFHVESNTIFKINNTNTTIPNGYVFFSKDNLDDYYFPTKGLELYSELSIFDDEHLNNINSAAYLALRSYIPLTRSLCLQANLHARMLFSDSYPDMKHTFVGGHSYEIYFNNHLPFYGLPPITVGQMYTYIGLIGVRLKVKNHYLSILGNTMFQSNDFKFTKQNNIKAGFALDYKFRSMIGPIGLTVSYSPWYNQPILSANVGFWF